MGKCFLKKLLVQSPASDFIATGKDEDEVDQLKKEFPGVAFTCSNEEAVSSASIIILCLKPQTFSVLLDISDCFNGKTVISIMASVSLSKLQESFPQSLVYRCMTNVASLVGEAMTVISCHDLTQLSTVRTIFENFGQVLVFPSSADGSSVDEEKRMNLVTAICGSGPAFFALFLESFVDASVMLGMSRSDAKLLASQTMKGTAELVLKGGMSPVQVKEHVGTPGGCTMAGLMELEEGKVRSTVAKCLEVTAEKASKLSCRK